MIDEPANPRLPHEQAPHTTVQVDRELHGATAEAHGTNYACKRDGHLMAQNVDWRNPWVRAIETDDPLLRDGLDCRDRK